jgi:hypothetical protein
MKALRYEENEDNLRVIISRKRIGGASANDQSIGSKRA